MKIEDAKTVWVAWTNTDLTEGRGLQIPKAVCEMKTTAVRMGKKGSVQGTNCNVTKETAVKIAGSWLVPGRIHSATREDKAEQERIDARADALKRAKEAGLTDEDVRLLAGAK